MRKMTRDQYAAFVRDTPNRLERLASERKQSEAFQAAVKALCEKAKANANDRNPTND